MKLLYLGGPKGKAILFDLKMSKKVLGDERFEIFVTLNCINCLALSNCCVVMHSDLSMAVWYCPNGLSDQLKHIEKEYTYYDEEVLRGGIELCRLGKKNKIPLCASELSQFIIEEASKRLEEMLILTQKAQQELKTGG